MKEIIKKIGLGISTVALLAFTAVGIIGMPAQAAPQDAICTGVQAALGIGGCGGSAFGEAEVLAVVRQVTNWILIAVGVICVIVIIFGGIRYATSGGDAEKVKNAKNTLLYAIIGLAIALLAGIIVNLVFSLTGTVGGSTSSGR